MFSCLLLDSFELKEIVRLKKNGATSSSHNTSSKTYFILGFMMNMPAIRHFFFLKLETEESVITFCKKRLSCDRALKRVWYGAHKHAGKHVISVNKLLLPDFDFKSSFSEFSGPFL